MFYFFALFVISGFPQFSSLQISTAVNARVGCERNSMTGLLRRVTADYGGRDGREGGGGHEVLGILQQPGLEPLRWRRNSSLLHGHRRKWLPLRK